MQKQTYSCGNDPQPGDVVEVVTMDDLPEESWANQAVREKLQKGNNYSVFAAAFGDWICLFNKPEIIWHHPSRFRLLRRAGEQPDYAKMLEEKDEAIRELRELLVRTDLNLALIEDSAHGVESKIIGEARGNIQQLLTKYKQP